MSNIRHNQPTTSCCIRQPEVSVIVPVYNAAPFLDSCIKSILSSTFVDFELILVDDGSTDGSSEICDSYKTAGRVSVIHTPNRGVSAARNTGIEVSHGFRIVFVDSDDMVSPAMIDRLVEMSKSANTRVAVVGVTMTGDMAEQGSTATTINGCLAAERMLRQKNYLYNPVPGGKIFDRTLFRSNRFRPGRYEDLDIMPKLFVEAGEVAFDPSPLYFYRQHSGAFSHTVSESRFDATAVTADLETWARQQMTPTLYKAARDRHFSAAFNVLNLLARNDRDGRYERIARECYDIICERRLEVLCSRKSRAKNRLGALVSYLGYTVLVRIARSTRY